MPLPTQKTPIKVDIRSFVFLVYGAPKIGKTTLCSNIPDALFLCTEQGHNNVEVFQARVASWEDAVQVLAELETSKHSYKAVVVDTVDNLYKFCLDYVCKKLKITHPSDLEYGKGFGLVNNEFQRVLTKLSLLPYGLFLLSHAEEKEQTTRTGKYMKTQPALPGAARKLVLGMVDVIAYCDQLEEVVDGRTVKRRIIRTKPDQFYEAGDRTGRLPEIINLNYKELTSPFHPKDEPETKAAPAKLDIRATDKTKEASK